MSYRHCAFLVTIPHFIVGLLTLTSPFVGAQQPTPQDVGDTPAQAKKISKTVSAKETLSSASDIDFFRFQINKDSKNPESNPNGNLTVTFSQKAPPGNNPKSGWRIDFYNESDLANTLYTALLPETRLSTKFQVGIGIGIYYYKISSMDNAIFPAAEYTLKGSWEESLFYERESNDLSDSATAITVNETYFGNLSSATEMDFYRFSLQNPDLVTITLSQLAPGSDDKSGWTVSLLGGSNQPLEVPSTQQSATLQVNLQAGEHYLRIASFPLEEVQCNNEEESSTDTSKQVSVEKKGPVGRGYQILVHAASVPLPPKECALVTTYGQNPVTLRWVSFPTPCEVPIGWHNTTVIPEGFQTCPVCSAIPHAKYTLNDQGILDIPLLDLFDAGGNNLGLYTVQLQGIPGPSPSEFKLMGATPKTSPPPASSSATVPPSSEPSLSPTTTPSSETVPSPSETSILPSGETPPPTSSN